MQIPKKGIAGFKEYWRKDLFAGFVVSLIALPLGLGLALASGAPPIAGIISAVVGGVIVAIFGGSFVTISGPGNGLAVATFAAIELLGNGNMQQGWYYTMAAIVVSGVILFILGLFRFGSLSDFFPSVAVEGMLGAIGFIILARQLHVMLGYNPEADSALEFIGILPETVNWLFTEGSIFTASIGVVSLIIMVGYSAIRIKWFHIVPAPMWVVILSILLSFSLSWQGMENLIPNNMKISIPEDLFGQYKPPNFNLFFTSEFWIAVITLTLIASIESLLSIKGIERLDVYKRRANVNKDLKAHGLATSVSGLLGGLNVVTVIARSSVNVGNGAQTRYSNLFHGVIIALIILFLNDLVTRIPLPALAAILVYTGYKLISPSNIKRISELGWEALTIYVITFVVTVAQGIITGIVSGVLVTFILQLVTTRRAALILRNLFRPNALLLLEDDGTYLLSVQKYANFMNYIRIKNNLDTIPTGSNIIVDFTLCEFIDNSVMEHLHNYNELHEQKGGRVEIIGLDDLRATSDHQFAPWIPIVGKKTKKTQVLTQRQQDLKVYAKEIDMEFYDFPIKKKTALKNFNYFNTKSIDVIRNQVTGRVQAAHFNLFDLDYHLGEFIAKESIHSTVITVHFYFDMPEFILHEESFFDKLSLFDGFSDINFDKYPHFSSHFFLKGADELFIRNFFSDKLITFFENNPNYNIECKNNRLLILDKERFSSINEIKTMVSFAVRLAELIQDLHKEQANARIEIAH